MTLDEIKRHPNFPFKNFSTDDLDFLMIELYWAELFKEAVPKEKIGAWQPELPADREEGNPILFVVNRNVTPPRMLRVILRFNDGQLPELNLDTLALVRFEHDVFVPFVPDLSGGALDEDMTTRVQELVISSSISESCERLFREYVKLWCGELVPEGQMAAFLDEYWKKVNSSLAQVAR